MAYLLDTNVLSELRKGRRCDAKVARWARATALQGHYISVLSIGEIYKGIELLRRRNEKQAALLDIWLRSLEDQYEDAVLTVSTDIAKRWGELNALRTLPVIDGLLAATALEYNLSVATRNYVDFPQEVQVVNPFAH